MRAPTLLLLFAMLAGHLVPSDEALAQAPFNSVWRASYGLFPDEVCPWSLFDTATPESPAFSGGKLLILTDSDEEYVYYRQTDGVGLAIPDPWIIEARVRVLSESHGRYGTRAAAIGGTLSTQLEFYLNLTVDEIHLNNAPLDQGVTAAVDTDDAFHTYRVEVSGGSMCQVFQDDVLVLSDSLYTHDVAPAPRLFWGDGTSNAHGRVEWEFVRHNGASSPCGASPVSAQASIETGSWGRIKAVYR